MNKTLICLIPKTRHLESADQFRSISLCNVTLKIATKLIADRLRGALDSIISPAQSAFIHRRLISDNILIVHEVFHYIKKRKKDWTKLFALKLDMRKAYNRLDWRFVEAILSRLGFHHRWVQLVMECIRSVSYSLLINGSTKVTINPSCGIRQADPLSSALFILCSQVLSSVITAAEANGSIQGIRVRNRGPKMTHLLFADDCLLFGQANLQEVTTLKDCLELYCKASGQEVKSSLTFSPNTHSSFKRWFSKIIKIPYDDGPSKHLGLPTEFGTSKAILFNDLKDKTLKRMQGWKQNLLSHAGKEVLLKSIAFYMSNFASSHFKLLSSFHSQIRKVTTNFYWGDSTNKNKIYWVSGSRLCRSKQKGGLSFKDPKLENQALLSKLAWRL
ncbi:uncharacterized protein LOC122651103 [Telopea speciosissima]|uniref:uncharacterized protein LOC122651103 n=1 Tax=Telopea speciosissima TaxID=54955 RepID=UPI001CC7D755|nr:uncharacterized protein LOC122651103 [Telopea speciosissima]